MPVKSGFLKALLAALVVTVVAVPDAAAFGRRDGLLRRLFCSPRAPQCPPQFICPPYVPPDDVRSGERVIHAVLVGSTKDVRVNGGRVEGNGLAAKKSLEHMESLLKEQIPAEYLKTYVLVGDDCNSKIILEKIRSIRSDDNDTIFYFSHTHGAFNPEKATGDPSGGHFCSCGTGDELYRKELNEVIQSKSGRLKVIITESCNKSVPDAPTATYKSVTKTKLLTVSRALPVEQLLRYHKGYIDINAASPGQYSWNSHSGGLFAYETVQCLREDERWDDLKPKLMARTSSRYKEQRAEDLKDYAKMDKSKLTAKQIQTFEDYESQKDQNPVAYRFDVVRDVEIETRPMRTVSISEKELIEVK